MKVRFEFANNHIYLTLTDGQLNDLGNAIVGRGWTTIGNHFINTNNICYFEIIEE